MMWVTMNNDRVLKGDAEILKYGNIQAQLHRVDVKDLCTELESYTEDQDLPRFHWERKADNPRGPLLCLATGTGNAPTEPF